MRQENLHIKDSKKEADMKRSSGIIAIKKIKYTMRKVQLELFFFSIQIIQ